MKNTIVIVDDTHTCQEILRKSVEKLGYKTLLCNDGVEAIDCLKKNSDSVFAVFLDIYMPQIDGISVLGHFRSNYPNLPVFIMTSSDDVSDKRSADGLGAAGFIKKPFIIDAMENTVKDLLDRLSWSKRAAS